MIGHDADDTIGKTEKEFYNGNANATKKSRRGRRRDEDGYQVSV